MQRYMERMQQTPTYRRMNRQVQTAIRNELREKSEELTNAIEPFQPAINIVKSKTATMKTRMQNTFNRMYAENQFYLRDTHETMQRAFAGWE